MRYLWIGVAGAAGSVVRYSVDGLVIRNRDTAFPLGTLVINLSGCFVLGLLFELLTGRFIVSPTVRTALMVGFVGAYTTFSTFSLETLRLIEDGASVLALSNVAFSVVGGILAAWAGTAIGRAV